jgi:hypothetical protein
MEATPSDYANFVERGTYDPIGNFDHNSGERNVNAGGSIFSAKVIGRPNRFGPPFLPEY